ncbi:MAG: ATP-grasp domain-containing protein [Sedimentisphaerales bacterium]|nr:ATP-grasp domain-containing protein [Sedimentisphaerales bacterium]
MEKKRVLVLDGAGRQCLPIMRSLKKAGNYVVVICPTRCCEGYFSRYADKRLIWPDIYEDERGFYLCLLNYLKANRCDVILPLGDVTAHLVSLHKQKLSEYTSMPVPDYDVFMRAADKAQTMEYCMAGGIPCPRTYDVEKKSLEEIIAEVPFPVMVKPRRGIGAVGLHRFETQDMLRKHYDAVRIKYGPLIIQEFIPLSGTQFQAEAFCNANSKMTVCMVIGKPRFFPVTGGTSTCNITTDRPDIVENVRRLLEGIKWVGSADVDLILDPRDNVPKILEINPRVTAGIKIGFEAGIDYADLQLRLALGEDVPVIKEYKLGVVLRNLCLDILWYKYSDKVARKSTVPPFWRFFGSNIKYQTFRIDDPFPFIGFILGNLTKYTKPGAWSQKVGSDIKK